MMSVAQEQEWPHESHRALKNAAIWFSQLRQGPLIEAYFGIALKFHRHFYHDSMEDWNATPIGRWYRCLSSNKRFVMFRQPVSGEWLSKESLHRSTAIRGQITPYRSFGSCEFLRRPRFQILHRNRTIAVEGVAVSALGVGGCRRAKIDK